MFKLFGVFKAVLSSDSLICEHWEGKEFFRMVSSYLFIYVILIILQPLTHLVREVQKRECRVLCGIPKVGQILKLKQNKKAWISIFFFFFIVFELGFEEAT